MFREKHRLSHTGFVSVRSFSAQTACQHSGSAFCWSWQSEECVQYQINRSRSHRINSHFLIASLAFTEQVQSCSVLTAMSNAARPSWVSPLLSCVTLLLFCAGFLRVELKMKQQDARLDALEFHSAHSQRSQQVFPGEYSSKQPEV